MATNTPKVDHKGFFAALFDFSLTSFVTLKFLKLIYIVVTVLVCLGTVGAFFAFVLQGGVGILIGVIFVPLVGLLYLIIARVYVELIAVLFRIGENTSIMAAALSGGTVPSLGGADPFGDLSPSAVPPSTPPPSEPVPSGPPPSTPPPSSLAPSAMPPEPPSASPGYGYIAQPPGP